MNNTYFYEKVLIDLDDIDNIDIYDLPVYKYLERYDLIFYIMFDRYNFISRFLYNISLHALY